MYRHKTLFFRLLSLWSLMGIAIMILVLAIYKPPTSLSILMLLPGLLLLISSIPAIAIARHTLPKLTHFLGSFWSTVIIGIVSTFIIIFASALSSHLLFWIFRFNPNQLPYTQYLLTAILSIEIWFFLISAILLIIPTILFPLIHTFPGIFIQNWKGLSWQEWRDRALFWSVGLFFWGICLSLVYLIPDSYTQPLINLIKITAVKVDYYPTSLLNNACKKKAYKYPYFTQEAPGILSVYMPANKGIGRFETIKCTRNYN